MLKLSDNWLARKRNEYWNNLTAICMAYQGQAGTAERIHVYMYALVKAVYVQIRLRT